MTMNTCRRYILVLLALPAMIAGCLGVPSITGKSLPLKARGNVVVSCYNATSKPVTWRIALLDAAGNATTIETIGNAPKALDSLSVEAPVAKIGIGSIQPGGVGAVVEIDAAREAKVVYNGPALVRHTDFADGDVISLSIVETGAGQYKIMADVTAGG